ncbi:MAG: OFA family MFS transporter [Bacillota bacterium]
MSKNDEEVKEELVRRRWIVLFGGFLLSLMGGMSYAWGSFVLPLVEDWGWTTAQANLPFTVMIIVFSIAMIPAGWLQDKYGPRKVAAVGAVLFLVGYSLAALMRYFPSPVWLTMTYGIGVGIACGLTYATIAPTARKWFADRPGFAVSCAVMGFGLAAVVFAPLKKEMIKLWGVDGTLFALGIFIAVVAFVGARLIRNPPLKWTPPGVDSNSQKNSGNTPIENVPPQEFVRTPRFYMLWLALASVIGGGLTAIGLLTAYGEIELQLAPAFAALAVSFYSLANGLGRPIVGWLADRWGTIRVMIGVYIIQGAVFLMLPWVATSSFKLFVCSLLLGLGYATTFALFPVIVAKVSGTKHLGMNYGLVFSAFGLGAITSLIGSWLLDLTGSFNSAFLLAGFATLFGLFLLLILYKKFLIR